MGFYSNQNREYLRREVRIIRGFSSKKDASILNELIINHSKRTIKKYFKHRHAISIYGLIKMKEGNLG